MMLRTLSFYSAESDGEDSRNDDSDMESALSLDEEPGITRVVSVCTHDILQKIHEMSILFVLMEKEIEDDFVFTNVNVLALYHRALAALSVLISALDISLTNIAKHHLKNATLPLINTNELAIAEFGITEENVGRELIDNIKLQKQASQSFSHHFLQERMETNSLRIQHAFRMFATQPNPPPSPAVSDFHSLSTPAVSDFHSLSK
jgi:hypothetical protein